MVNFILAILLVFPIISSVQGQCNGVTANSFYKRSVFEFSADLIARISEDRENHFVTSPFSLWTLIASLTSAAEGATLQEMRDVLKLHRHVCFLNKYFATVYNVFVSDGHGTTLEKSSALFIDENLPVKESFIDKMSKIGIMDIEKESFSNFEQVANIINRYVSSGTAGTINEIVTSEDIQGAYLILIDALYFKGEWNVPFLSEDTEMTAFYDNTGLWQLGDVNMMFMSNEFNVTSIKQIRSTVLELPYGTNGRFAMLLFLPDHGVSLSSVINSLKSISLRTIYGLFSKDRPEKINVQIPRFKITSDLDNMKELLTDMGLKTMFENTAQFSSISDYPLYLSNLVQRAGIEVTEEGTTAAAASAAEFESRASPIDFTANKPFMYMIIDVLNEIPLFIGAYAKPSLY